MEVLKILKKLVSFNTIEDNENNEIIEWIEKYLLELGFKCKKITDKQSKKKCLVAQLGRKPILAFSGHLDTVNATEDWKESPFKMRIENNKVYGLGVCDMKGGIAAFLKACAFLKNRELKKGIKLYFTYDEEIGFSGINLLIQNKEVFPKYLILSEPTDLEPVIATKGCMEMKATFYGKSTHSSTPNKGKNAIVEANKFIQELLEFSKELEEEKNEMFSIPYTTINIGIIKGGDAVNKVPDKCTVTFDARTINKSHNDIIEERIKKILKKYDSKLEIGINIQANINDDNEMITCIEEITGKRRKTENYVTEASFIENIEAVILGLGPITAHQSNEYIEKDKIYKLVDIYTNIIKKYCL